MAVTRIKNNQITDSTITYQKIASGTLVGSLFNSNITLNSNVSIIGNLQVSGNTTTIQSIDTLVSDPLVIFNNGFTGSPSYDIGLLINRNLQSLDSYGGMNAAWVWREADGAFEGLLTTETGTTNGSINRSYFANLTIGNANVVSKLTTNSLSVSTLNATTLNTSGVYTSSGNIVAASGANATNYTTGALVVPGGGGVGITGDLWVQGPSTFAGNIVAGNIILSGNINVPVGGTFSNTGVFFGNAGGIGALYAGTSTYTSLPTTVLQLSGNVNTYAQVNFQNINSGTKASTDFVLTADNGNDTDGYLDLGINSSTFGDAAYPGFYPNDGYLVHHTATGSGNLVIFSHEAGSAIKLHVGEYGDSNVKVTVTNSGLRVNTSTSSTTTTSGALIVDGGVGIGGALNVGGISTLPTLTSTTLFATNLSTGNAVITGTNTYIGNQSSGIANIYAVTGGVGTLTAATLNSSTANITAAGVGTLQATNFSSGNAVITGGSINATVIGNTTPAVGTFTYSNATSVYSSDATITTVNSTTANVTTVDASTINAGTETVVTLNVTTGNLTTFTGNSGNVNYIYGNVANIRTSLFAANLNSVDAYTTNVYAKFGGLETSFVGNLMSGNACLSGGYIDGSPIGANVRSYGKFTTIELNSSDNSSGLGSGSFFTYGGAAIEKDLYVGGNVYANTIITVNKEILTVVEPLLYLSPSASSPYNYEIGLFSNFTGGSLGTYQHSGIVRNHTDNYWYLFSNAAEPAGSTVNLSDSNLVYDTLKAGNLILANTQQSASTSTGVLVVGGGVGVGGNINAGNVNTSGVVSAGTINTTILNVNGTNITTVDAGNITAYGANITSANITTLTTSGITTGLGNIVAASSASSTNTTSGALVVVGGVGIGENLNVGGNFASSGNLNAASINNTVIGNVTPATGVFTTLAVTTWANVAKLNVNASISTDTLSVASSATLSPSGTVTINPSTVSYMDNMNIGASNAANVYATNQKITTTLNVPATGAVWIRAGQVSGSAINNIPIGTVDPQTGVFTSLTTNTLQANTSANTNTLSAVTTVSTNFSTGNAVITGGYIDSVANIYATTGLITNFSTGNARITGGFADNYPIGANTAATGAFTNLTASNISVSGGLQVAAIGNITPGTAAFTTVTTTGTVKSEGNIVSNSATTSTSTTTGALVLPGIGGAGIGGNINVGQGAIINSTNSVHDTIIRGVNNQTLLMAISDSTYDQVLVGGNVTLGVTNTQGAKLQINSTDSLLLPAGSSAQRPSGQGFTDVAGMVRFNTTSNQLEFYNGTEWKNTGSTFTIITDSQYADPTGDIRGNVDGINAEFTLPSVTSTNGVVVSINGVLQLPTTAYSVSGTTMTFTEAPALGDIVDARIITTTASVTTLASPNGFNQVDVDNGNVKFYTGTIVSGTIDRWHIDTTGNIYPNSTSYYLGTPTNRIGYIYASNIDISGGTLSGVSLGGGSLDNTPIGGNIASTGAFTTIHASTSANVQILHSNTAVSLGNATIINDDSAGYSVATSTTGAIDGFDKTLYRGAKFFVQLSDTVAGEYQVAEVVLVHNDSTATIETYGVTWTGSANLATFSANIAGSTCWLNATSYATNTLNAKVSTQLMKI
jgi:hypothetical protein